MFEHRKLLEDLTKYFFTKKINTRKVEKKIGHAYYVVSPFLTIKFTMVLDRPRKLKHLALRSIYYRLLNTSCIFTYNRWKYCRCNQFQGCRLKSMWSTLSRERNYCYACRVGVTYNEEKIKNIKKIADITYNFRKIKEDIQLYINFDSNCDKFWMFHYRTSYTTRLGTCKWNCLKNYTEEYNYRICWNDK